jgi:beta-N-acetylhexosaminidase
VKRHGALTGQLLRLFGFNLDLCPVLDISFDDEADNSLRGRCYGNTVEEVVQMADAFNQALRKEGVGSCGKHFPGYSGAMVDAHHDLPRIDRTRAELEDQELAVFRQFAPRVDSMMICHGWYPTFNAEKLPASLSPIVVTDLLRNDVEFEGLVMTDDLDMGAIYNEYGLAETIRMAITAGNDMAMICHRIDAFDEAHRVLTTLPQTEVDRALENIARFKDGMSPPHDFLEAAFRKLDEEVWQLRVQVLGAERAAERSAEDGKRSPVEMY